jgi:hypothetical protein
MSYDKSQRTHFVILFLVTVLQSCFKQKWNKLSTEIQPVSNPPLIDSVIHSLSLSVKCDHRKLINSGEIFGPLEG